MAKRANDRDAASNKRFRCNCADAAVCDVVESGDSRPFTVVLSAAEVAKNWDELPTISFSSYIDSSTCC